MFFVWWWVPSSKNSRTYSHVYSLSLCGQFSSGQGPVRTRKAVANSQTSWLQRHFIFIQEVSGAYTSAFLDTQKLKMALRARNVSGAFEKRAPALSFENFWKYGGTFVDMLRKYLLVGNFQYLSAWPTLQWIGKINTRLCVITGLHGRAGRLVQIAPLSWHVALNTCLKILYSSTNYRKPQAVESE